MDKDIERAEEITMKVEDLLDEAWDLIADESTIYYNLYHTHRRIVSRCSEIISFFE